MPALLHPLLQPGQHGGVEAAAAALVGEGGVGEAVAQHGVAARQRRLDDVLEVVAPRRKDQQRLAQRVHGGMQHQFAQLFGQRRAAGFARHHHAVAALAQPIGQGFDVRALSRAVDAFESDETAAHGRPPRWNWFTARLCSARVSLKMLPPLPSLRATK